MFYLSSVFESSQAKLFGQARSLSLEACLSVCVCVERLKRRKASRPGFIIIYFLVQGITGSQRGRWSTKIPPRDLCKRTCRTLVVHLGAFKSQLVATILPYIIYVYVYVYVYMYICMYIYIFIFISPLYINIYIYIMSSITLNTNVIMYDILY